MLECFSYLSHDKRSQITKVLNVPSINNFDGVFLSRILVFRDKNCPVRAGSQLLLNGVKLSKLERFALTSHQCYSRSCEIRHHHVVVVVLVSRERRKGGLVRIVGARVAQRNGFATLRFVSVWLRPVSEVNKKTVRRLPDSRFRLQFVLQTCMHLLNASTW